MILLVSIVPIASGARSRNSQAYNGLVKFGPQIVQMEDGCLWIDGGVSSGTFFRGLKRDDKNSPPEYSNGSSIVVSYPESLTASIRILNDQCVAEDASSPWTGHSFTFDVSWKNGVQLTPALLSPGGVHCDNLSAISETQVVIAPPMECQMTIRSEGVPLINHLIVSVYAADGKRLTRLSAAP